MLTVHDDVAVFLEEGKGDEEDELAGVVVCPEGLPEDQYILPGKFTLEPDEEHSKQEEKVC